MGRPGTSAPPAGASQSFPRIASVGPVAPLPVLSGTGFLLSPPGLRTPGLCVPGRGHREFLPRFLGRRGCLRDFGKGGPVNSPVGLCVCLLWWVVQARFQRTCCPAQERVCAGGPSRPEREAWCRLARGPALLPLPQIRLLTDLPLPSNWPNSRPRLWPLPTVCPGLCSDYAPCQGYLFSPGPSICPTRSALEKPAVPPAPL